MFHLKKLLASVLFPVPLCLEILIVGVFLLWFTGRQKFGKIMVSIGTVLFLLFSFSPLSRLMLADLEHSYHPLNGHESGVHWIVVLGAGAFCDPDIPISNQVTAAGLCRVLEGVRLHNEYTQSKLIFTGNTAGYRMSEIAIAYGVPQDEIVVAPEARDTEEESRAIKLVVKNDRFVLVTSASHMPRSMALFEKQGMQPVPAPAEYLVKKSCPSPYPPVPDVVGLEQASTAFYEYMGLVWLKLTGKI